MNVLFISNYYTHHQKPLCEALDALTEHQFTFVETEEFSEERKRLGWKTQIGVPFVRRYEELIRSNKEAVAEADVVILGSAPLTVIRDRLKTNKLTFLYAERIYKNGYQPVKWLPRVFRFWIRYGQYRSLYLLSASAFTTGDYMRHGAFWGKSYRWGYFPETKQYDIGRLLDRKKKSKILWCGRFLDWKHPEAACAAAKRLKEDGCIFEMEFIGAGPLEEPMKQMALENGLAEHVRFLGAMDSDKVRTHMESAGIFLFTSDFHEGWGAVLNEALNSGCAVVASHAAGAVPFLLKERENGLIYRNGDIDELYAHVKMLLEQPELQNKLGMKAYQTIEQMWNADTAARRFLKTAEQIQHSGECNLYKDGPCSKAPIFWNNWCQG